ncbi:MAG: SH3-like domain-containing protein [Melioribacteraceae bacterium]|nr:SH3-like domain-containing protein [Melioribacteraceae bacterium]
MKVIKFLFLLSMIVMISSCSDKTEDNTQITDHKVEALEVIQATSYTYLRVKEKDEEYWIAVNKADFEEGETYYYDSGMEMRDFESRDLQRTFDIIYFVQNISSQPLGKAMNEAEGSVHMEKPVSEKTEVSVDPVEGGITIGDLYAGKENYGGSTVKVKGKVTKYNSNILGRNWIHIQDGTQSNGNYDLTITTTDKADIGDIIVCEGTVVLNKDFGAGYAYDLIIEDAKIIN